jgi:hypothetical protein
MLTKGAGKARLVIEMPLPVPMPFTYIVQIPGKVRLGVLSIGLSIRIGGGSNSNHGMVLGFAIDQKGLKTGTHNGPNTNSIIKQLFRQDYHAWHQPLYKGTNLDYQWQDKRGFHFHVSKDLK